MIKQHAFFDELEKLADVTTEEAQAAMKRLKQLDRDKPSLGQLGRGAAVGAIAAPLAATTSKLISGGFKGRGAIGSLRDLAGSSVSGAIFGGAVPFARHKLEHTVEEQKLKEYAGQRRRGKLRGQIRKTLGV